MAPLSGSAATIGRTVSRNSASVENGSNLEHDQQSDAGRGAFEQEHTTTLPPVEDQLFILNSVFQSFAWDQEEGMRHDPSQYLKEISKIHGFDHVDLSKHLLDDTITPTSEKIIDKQLNVFKEVYRDFVKNNHNPLLNIKATFAAKDLAVYMNSNDLEYPDRGQLLLEALPSQYEVESLLTLPPELGRLLENGYWKGAVMDIVIHAMPKIINRPIIIIGKDNKIKSGSYEDIKNAIILELDKEHYSLIKNDVTNVMNENNRQLMGPLERIAIPDNGDCFFYAILKAMDYFDESEIQQKIDEAIKDIRQYTFNHLAHNWDDYKAFYAHDSSEDNQIRVDALLAERLQSKKT